MMMPQLRFLILSQNAEKGTTNDVAPEETAQPKTVSKVSKVHIQLLGGLVWSTVIVFFF